jgi:hypothetical protein
MQPIPLICKPIAARSDHYNTRHARIIGSQKHPSCSSTSKKGLNPTGSIRADCSLPFTVLGVGGGQWSTLSSSLRGPTMQLNKCIFKARYLRPKCTLMLAYDSELAAFPTFQLMKLRMTLTIRA